MVVVTTAVPILLVVITVLVQKGTDSATISIIVQVSNTTVTINNYDCKLCNNNYSGTPLLWSPLGQLELS